MDVATCVNQLGSYYCICNRGFTEDGKASCIPEGELFSYHVREKYEEDKYRKSLIHKINISSNDFF